MELVPGPLTQCAVKAGQEGCGGWSHVRHRLCKVHAYGFPHSVRAGIYTGFIPNITPACVGTPADSAGFAVTPSVQGLVVPYTTCSVKLLNVCSHAP